MKNYISILSLIALFFVGMQQTQAQEKKTLDESQGKAKQVQMNELANKEREQSPEHKEKIEKLESIDANSAAKGKLSEIQEFVSGLTKEQQNDLHNTFLNLNLKLASFDSDDMSEETLASKAALNKDADMSITKILNEDQLKSYKEYLTSASRKAN